MISGRTASRRWPRSSVATRGTKESGTFSDSTRINVEDLYLFGRTKRATTDRARTATQGTITRRGRRRGACR